MNNTIIQTPFILPTYVVSNGETTGNPWTNPNNLLQVDNQFAESNAGAGVASDVIVGGYNFNLPQGAVVTGIELQVIGMSGLQITPPLTLNINAVDNTSGINEFYPYVPAFTGLTPTYASYILGTQTYLFATSFTVDQLNNLKFQLIANGDMYIDSILASCFYYIPTSPSPAPIVTGCDECNSVLQINSMQLNLPFLIGQTIMNLKPGSMQYPDGTPAQPGDMGSCGGIVTMTIDEGVNASQTQQGVWTENVSIPYDPSNPNTPTWYVLPDGSINIDLKVITNRALGFFPPYQYDSTLQSNHYAGAQVVITNNGPWTAQILKTCNIGTLVSPVIEVASEGASIVDPMFILNFQSGFVVTQDISNPNQANINAVGASVVPPQVVGVGYGTTGNVLANTLSFTIPFSGINRQGVIEILTNWKEVPSLSMCGTVSSVTVGGVPCTQKVEKVDNTNLLKSEIWVCNSQPPVGTQTVVITLTTGESAYITAGGEAFINVNQTVAVGNVSDTGGTSNNPLLTITTTQTNSLIVDSLGTGKTPILYLVGAGQSAEWSQFANIDTAQGASSYAQTGVSPDAVTMQWTITQNTPWVYTAIELLGIPSSSSSGITSINGNTNPTQSIVGTGAATVTSTGGVTTINVPTGGSGITSINGNTNASQTFAAGNDMSVASSAGTTTYASLVDVAAGFGISVSKAASTFTVTNTGAGGIYGKEYKFLYSGVASSYTFNPIGAVWFGSYLISTVFVSTASYSYSAATNSIFTSDAVTGAMIGPISNTVDFGQSISISADVLSLYTLSITINSSGFTNNQAVITLKQYDNTLTLINTATGTFTESYAYAFINKTSSTFFVQGSHLVILGLGTLSAPTPGANYYSVDLTISGSSLTTLTQTTVAIGTWPNAQTVTYAFGGVDSTYTYLQSGNTINQATYSGGTFTSVGSITLPINTPSPSGAVRGFNSISSGTVGIMGMWRNTSVVTFYGGTSYNQYSSGIYDKYSY